jgi:uncharacterized protein YacL
VGYGLGVFLLATGLILALAVTDRLNDIDLTMAGWILALCGALVLALTAMQANRSRRSTAVTQHSDGAETRSERRTEPPVV